MIVNYLDVLGPSFRPSETNPKLVVNADTMLPFSVSFQRFKPISGRHSKVVELHGRIKLVELPKGDIPQISRKQPPGIGRIYAIKDIFSAFISERPDH